MVPTTGLVARSVNGAYYRASSPQDADRQYHGILQAEANRVGPIMQAAGLDPGNALLMASYLDIWNQSPIMAQEGFLATLPYLAKNGISPDTLLQARIYAGDAGVGTSGFNPTGVAHGSLWTNMAGHSADQKRRMDEIVKAMTAIGIPTNGSLTGLVPAAVSGDKGFTPMSNNTMSNQAGTASLGTNGGSVIIGTYTKDCTKTPPWDWTMQGGKIYRGCVLRITTLGIEAGKSSTPMVGAMTTSNNSKATMTNASLVSTVTPPKAGSILSPVPGVSVNSAYGPRWGQMHKGVDMAAAEGTPLLATMDGVIGDTGYEPGYGNYVAIKHADGSIGETFYGHMVKPGEFPTGTAVKAGQVIGYMGTTGRSTGPHLHFEVRSPSGQLIDPETVIQR
ncbi:peptidase family M23 [Microcoleus phage My-WqHQDG]|nr:peptidase family M23 [Microcoleus phage My-WqHQDG]